MSARPVSGSFIRSVLTYGEMNIISCRPTPLPIFRCHRLLSTYSNGHRQEEYRRDNHGRYHKHSRWFAASGLGITLVTHSGSLDSDHLQNFCETNFDTVRPTRSSVPRSILPTFGVCVAPFDENSSIGTKSKSLDDDTSIQDSKSIRRKLSHPRSRVARQSFDSVEPPFDNAPMVVESTACPRAKLESIRPIHPPRSISQSTLPNQHFLSVPCHSSASRHHTPRHLSPSATPPTSSCSSLVAEASDPALLATFPNYYHSGSTRPPPRLRNCHSLQFVKPKHHQSPYLSHSNFVNPQSRSITPLITSRISNQLPCVPSSPSHESSADFCAPDQPHIPAPTSVTSQSTKFTNFVRSTLHKTSRRSMSSLRSPSQSDLKSQSESCHPPSSSAATFSHYNSSSRSLSLGPSTEFIKPSLLYSYTPPLSMSRTYETEIESLQDQRASLDIRLPPLRSSLSQPFLTQHYQKTSLGGSRSHSALDSCHSHPFLHRTGSSLSGLANLSSVTASGSSSQQQHPPSKNPNFTSLDSPPRKSMRTQFSRLAQLLAPSPAPKRPPGPSKVKASTLTSKPIHSFSNGSTSSKSTQSRSKHVSCTVLDTLPLSSQFASATATMPVSITNWRNTVSDRDYQYILDTWGPTEIHRQKLIWELCQTETGFLESLNLVLDLFLNPLKKSGLGSWVAGVPEAVQNLFSDLDNIANLHSEIIKGMNYNRMCENKRNNAPVVIRFADMMAAFVPRLRIYERYLVCFERVCQVIDRLSADQADNFGVFIKIQSDAAGLGGMTLTSYLLKPIQRLMKYPLFFRQLGETTPVGHPDHAPTSHLWKATDGIIRSMQDVKGMEDDHNSLRTLEEQLIGLPDGFVLANRKRKIVARGKFQRVHLSPKDMVKLPEPSRNRLGSNANHFSELMPMSGNGSSSRLVPVGDSKNHLTTYRMVRCLSPVSDSSENSEGIQSQKSYHSIISDSTFDLANAHRAPICRASRTSWSASGCSADSSSCAERLSQDWTAINVHPPRPLLNKRSSRNLIKRGPSTEIVEVILLSDLLIFCVREPLSKKNWRSSSKKFEDSNRLRLLDGIGISRLMEVEDLGGQLDHFEDLVRLELFPELGSSANFGTKKAHSLSTHENNGHNSHVIYLSSMTLSSSQVNTNGDTKKSSRSSLPYPEQLGTGSNLNLNFNLPKAVGMGTELDWKAWLKEFRKLELLTHHFHRRHLKLSELKTRRSTTGKIQVSMKRCSSMNNLAHI